MFALKPYNPPPADQLKSVFIDDHLVVADKPSGLLSVPGLGPEKAICAQSILTARHGEVLTVHRLDMDTSGLIIFARSKDSQRAMSQQFERREIRKVYEALVQGAMQNNHGLIDKAIAKYSRARPLRHLDPEGQQAITHWSLIERSVDKSRVRLMPKTGRSHQLRLHMASLGHPILGDVFYGDPASHQRLCLHASEIAFTHPVTDEAISLIVETPF